MNTQAGPEPLVRPCLDYGRSFVCTLGPENAPRFWVESRCRITDGAGRHSVEYYQCGSCKSEHTFAPRDLFMDPNYDFLPIFSEDTLIVFRRHAWCGEGYRHHALSVGRWDDSGETDPRFQYREVREMKGHPVWGGMVPCLREATVRPLANAADIDEAHRAGLPVLAQTLIRDAATGHEAVLEYPVKTMNLRAAEGLWQVDTGPLMLPDLSQPPERWAQTCRLAFIAFNTWDWADCVIEQPTPILRDGEEIAWVYHYSGLLHLETRNVLLAQELD